jgi:hypothetical protein
MVRVFLLLLTVRPLMLRHNNSFLPSPFQFIRRTTFTRPSSEAENEALFKCGLCYVCTNLQRALEF